MRNLTQQETVDIVASNGYAPGSGRFIEAKVSELAAANIGTACGGA